MPETRYTDLCHTCYELVCLLDEFGSNSVLTAMLELRHDKSRADVKREIAIVSTYSRILNWLESLKRLNKTQDAQAIGAGARAVFELYLDLCWFQRHPGPEWGKRWAAFPEVDRFQAAQKVVNHVTNTPHSSLNPAAHKAFMDQLNSKESMDVLVKRVWGEKSDGSPKWPRFHWTGVSNLEERARVLGVEYLDAYRQIYPILSCLVHPGPTAYLRRTFEDFELHVGYAYFYTFKHAHEATLLAVELAGVKPRIEGFEPTMAKLITCLDDAIALMNP